MSHNVPAMYEVFAVAIKEREAVLQHRNFEWSAETKGDPRQTEPRGSAMRHRPVRRNRV
jgi:hypothetical protein